MMPEGIVNGPDIALPKKVAFGVVLKRPGPTVDLRKHYSTPTLLPNQAGSSAIANHPQLR
jgi:hypothetical protein